MINGRRVLGVAASHWEPDPTPVIAGRANEKEEAAAFWIQSRLSLRLPLLVSLRVAEAVSILEDELIFLDAGQGEPGGQIDHVADFANLAA